MHPELESSGSRSPERPRSNRSWECRSQRLGRKGYCIATRKLRPETKLREGLKQDCESRHPPWSVRVLEDADSLRGCPGRGQKPCQVAVLADKFRVCAGLRSFPRNQ